MGSRMLGFVTACALAIGAVPAGDAAAAGPRKATRSAPVETWTSPRFAFRTDVPRTARAPDYTVEHEPAPADAAPHQIQESLVILRQGHELVRLDVFVNPEKLDVATWFETANGWLRMPQSRLEPTVATRARTPALRLRQPRTGQTHARELVFFAAGDLLLRATSEQADDAAAKAILDRLVDRLVPAKAAPKPRSR